MDVTRPDLQPVNTERFVSSRIMAPLFTPAAARLFHSLICCQVLAMGVTVWLVKWSRHTEEEQGSGHHLTVLVLLTLSALVVSLLRTILTFFSLVKVRP